MYDPDPGPGCFFFWGFRRPTLRQWLLFIVTFVLLCVALFHLFSWLGWESDVGGTRVPLPEAPSRTEAH